MTAKEKLALKLKLAKAKRIIAGPVPSRTTEGMGLLERVGELAESGVRQGAADVGGLPRAITEAAAAPATPSEKARTVRGSVSPEQRQQRLAASEAEKQRIGQFAQANLPSGTELRQGMADIVGPETLPTEASGRILQGAVRGGTAGALFGPASAGYAALSGGLGQTVRELPSFPGQETAATVAEIAGPLGVGGLKTAIRPRGPAPPTTERLREMADQAYDAIRTSNVQVQNAVLQKTGVDMIEELFKSGFHPRLQREANRTLEVMLSELSKPLPRTIGEVESLRQILRSASKTASEADRQMIETMIDKFDDNLTGIMPTDMRELWAKYRKSSLIEDAIERANLNASSAGVGGNIENTTRQAFKGLLLNKKKMRGFTETEERLIRNVADSGTARNMARLFSKLSPTSGGLSAWLNMLGFPILGPYPAFAGAISKALSDTATKRAAGKALRATQGGGQLTPRRPFPARNIGLGIAGQSLTGPLQ